MLPPTGILDLAGRACERLSLDTVFRRRGMEILVGTSEDRSSRDAGRRRLVDARGVGKRDIRGIPV